MDTLSSPMEIICREVSIMVASEVTTSWDVAQILLHLWEIRWNGRFEKTRYLDEIMVRGEVRCRDLWVWRDKEGLDCKLEKKVVIWAYEDANMVAMDCAICCHVCLSFSIVKIWPKWLRKVVHNGHVGINRL